MEKVASYQIMTISALLIIGEGPQNFCVGNNVPVKTDNANVAIAALPLTDTDGTSDQKNDGKNSIDISAPEQHGDMTLI